MPLTSYLPNGLCVIVEPMPASSAVAITCHVGVGSRYETAAQSGIAHMLEHMCFKGTQHYPTALDLSRAIEGIGGEFNACTDYESTAYYVKVADLHAERGVGVLAELVTRPTLDAAELEKERGVILAEIRDYRDTPTDAVHTMLQSSLYGDQPLGREIIGTRQTVRTISHHDLTAFWQQHYTPATVIVSIAGNIAPDRAHELVAQHFGALAAAPAHPPPAPCAPPVAGPRVTLRNYDSEQGHFCLGLPGVSQHDPDRRALDVLDTIVGGDMSSRLFQLIREQHGLAYSVGSYNSTFLDSGMWVLYASVKRRKLADAVRAMLTVLHDVATHGITPAELAYVQEQVRGGLRLSLDDSAAIAARNAHQYHAYGTIQSLEAVIAEYDQLTCDDIHRVAQRVISSVGLHLAIIGDYGKTDKERLRTVLEDTQL